MKYVPLGILGLIGAMYATYALTFTRVAAEIEIRGEAGRIFDLVTTAKYWSEWHPATLAVSGDIEHPMRVGDLIHERVDIFGPAANVDWTVTRVDRPRSLTLRGHSLFGGRATIDYQFTSQGDMIRFTRAIDYAFFGLGGPLDWFWIRPLMERQSAKGLQNLKTLIEWELAK